MSESRAMLEDAAFRLFADVVTQPTIEAAERGVFPEPLWDTLRDLGFHTLLVPEQAGGSGGDLEDAAGVLRAAGYHAAPGPVAETIVGNGLLAAAGREPVGGAVAVLIGDARRAAWLGSAHAVVRARGDRVMIIEPAGPIAETSGVIGEPIHTLAVEKVIAETELTDAEGRSLRSLALLRAAQMVGAMEWCVERTAAYALERSQFGRPLARLQVVQQYLAQAAGELASADAITGAAALAGADATLLVAAARSRCAEAADTVSALCHQVHGAIGFSREYALNFRTRRLMSWRDDAGSVVTWRRMIGEAMTDTNDGPWPALTAAMSRA